jgi:hypothetical protein
MSPRKTILPHATSRFRSGHSSPQRLVPRSLTAFENAEFSTSNVTKLALSHN